MIWAVLIVVAMGLLVGVFLSVAVKKPLVMVVIATAIFSAVVVFVWNCVWRRRGLLGFINNYPNAVLIGAIDLKIL
ncbi:unnamed protein product [Arabis nemorensis]|uniref:Uncharacterized protein n=1 Tax=Arabis nemorensis TaxID=586526 RepID=A0A565AQ56_9BRAS|nr:unnamed protein product [Arabis nemorensis]